MEKLSSFWHPRYEDYLVHCDEERQKKYLARAKNIKLKQKGQTYLYQFRISKLLECEYSLVKILIMKRHKLHVIGALSRLIKFRKIS